MSRSGKETRFLTAAGPSGDEIRIPVATIHGARDGPTVVMVAGVHGSEYVGIEACKRIFAHTAPEAVRGTLVTVPCLNLPAFFGLAAHVNPLDGMNPGRVFPGNPSGSHTERMTHLVWELAQPADFLVDIHGGDLEEELVNYSQVNLTGNARVDGQAEALALALNMPFFLRVPAPTELPRRNAGLHPVAASHGIPAALAEAGSHGVLDEADVALLTAALRNALRQTGMLDEPLDPPRTPMTLRRFVGTAAPVDGFWYPSVHKGALVRPGQVVGEMRGFFDERLGPVVADVEGVILGVIATPARRKGDMLLGLGTLK